MTFRTHWRDTGKWVFGALLFVNVGVLLFVLSFAHVTAEGPSKRALRQSVAILTEVDAFLDDRFETFRIEAGGSQDRTLTLPDFPVPVTFAPAEVRDLEREEFRALLLDRAAERLYAEGSVVMKEDPRAEISFFSPQGALRGGMDFLRPTPHRVLTMLAIALASLAGVLAAGLLSATRGYGRLLALGLSVFLAATPFLVSAVAVRFAFRLAADGLDEYLAREFLQLAQELTWAPIRNGIVFAVGGGITLLAGVLLARWDDTRPVL